jgi:hypothetical protein
VGREGEVVDVKGSPIGQALEAQFKVAAGEAAWLELHMRLLVGAHPETKSLEPARLEEVEDGIVNMAEKLGFDLKKDEIAELRKIRNKLFHGQFDALSKLVSGQTGEQPRGAVYQVDWRNPSKKPVAVSSLTQKEAGIYGWMLNSLSQGDLANAKPLFIAMTNKITELAEFSSGKNW